MNSVVEEINGILNILTLQLKMRDPIKSESINSNNTGSYLLFRWILFLPLAILAAIVITFPLHWILYMTLSGGQDPFITPYPELPEKLFQPFCSGLVFVYVSAKLAPKYKKQIAAITVAVWCLLAILAIMIGYSEFSINRTTFNLDYLGFPIMFGIAGAVLGYVLTKRSLKPI